MVRQEFGTMHLVHQVIIELSPGEYRESYLFKNFFDSWQGRCRALFITSFKLDFVFLDVGSHISVGFPNYLELKPRPNFGDVASSPNFIPITSGVGLMSALGLTPEIPSTMSKMIFPSPIANKDMAMMLFARVLSIGATIKLYINFEVIGLVLTTQIIQPKAHCMITKSTDFGNVARESIEWEEVADEEIKFSELVVKLFEYAMRDGVGEPVKGCTHFWPLRTQDYIIFAPMAGVVKYLNPSKKIWVSTDIKCALTKCAVQVPSDLVLGRADLKSRVVQDWMIPLVAIPEDIAEVLSVE